MGSCSFLHSEYGCDSEASVLLRLGDLTATHGITPACVGGSFPTTGDSC